MGLSAQSEPCAELTEPSSSDWNLVVVVVVVDSWFAEQFGAVLTVRLQNFDRVLQYDSPLLLDEKMEAASPRSGVAH